MTALRQEWVVLRQGGSLHRCVTQAHEAQDGRGVARKSNLAFVRYGPKGSLAGVDDCRRKTLDNCLKGGRKCV